MQGAPRAGLSRRGRGAGPGAAAGRAGFVPPFVGKAIAHHTGMLSFAEFVSAAALPLRFSCSGASSAMFHDDLCHMGEVNACISWQTWGRTRRHWAMAGWPAVTARYSVDHELHYVIHTDRC